MNDSSDFVPRVLESRAKSIDEAIFKGMNEMGVSIDEVLIETIQEGSKGILGIGSKPYIVRLTEKDPNATLRELKESQAKEKLARSEERFNQNIGSSAPLTTPLMPSALPKGKDLSPNATAEKAGFSSPTDQRPRQAQRTTPLDREKTHTQRDPNRNRSNNRSRVRNDRDRRDHNVSNVAQQYDYTPFIPGESDCDGAEFLLGLLKQMGVDASIGFYKAEGLIKYRIDSETMGILIGHRGETLDAMQYLTSLVVNRGQESYRRVTLDTENYRRKREETLVRLARKIAAQVKATNQAIPLEPMNPYERRVLHAALQRNPYVETHSEGEELNRHVVIAPKRK